MHMKKLLLALFCLVGSGVYAQKNSHNGHEWIDLGLPSGLKWATCNVGASSPGDYGNYYAWGETSTKGDYSWSTYEWFDNFTITVTKYKADELDPSDDAATANWGGDWRLPTEDEFRELLRECTWEWTTQNGHNGYKVTGPNGQSIFLPAAGWRYGAVELSVGSYGNFWSSSPNESYTYFAYYLYFLEDYRSVGWGSRYSGLSVRPVLE